MKNVLIATFTLMLLMGCASRKALKPEGNLVEKKGVLGISGDWIKDKGKKVDLQLRFINQSKDFLVILYSDFECKKGTLKGRGFSPFGLFGSIENQMNAIESLIDKSFTLNPDEEKDLAITCEFKEANEGPFSLRVKNIYRKVSSNRGGPKLDNVGKDLMWTPNLAP